MNVGNAAIVTPMDMSLSKLSPQARKALRRNAPGVRLRATVELARGKNPDQLALISDDGTVEVLSWSPQSHLMVLEIDSEELKSLAEDAVVTYVEVGGTMWR